MALICDGWTCVELNVINALDIYRPKGFEYVINLAQTTSTLILVISERRRPNYKCVTSNQ